MALDQYAGGDDWFVSRPDNTVGFASVAVEDGFPFADTVAATEREAMARTFRMMGVSEPPETFEGLKAEYGRRFWDIFRLAPVCIELAVVVPDTGK